MKNKIFLCAGLWIFSMCAFAEVNDSGIKVKWGYTGEIAPEKWGQLSPEFALCGKGKAQSPVNISREYRTILSALSIDYQAAPMIIEDDGVTSLQMGNTQVITNDGHGIQLNFPVDGPKETIMMHGNQYRLLQFHIHTPSENTLNGKSFPMEIHFVHQGKNGQIAVIGVLVRSGAANATLQNIISHFPKDHGVAQTISGERINPMNLIPEKQNYYTFVGSLTTPPCTEGLQWVVMANSITASPEQIKSFSEVVEGNNARPIQALNGRKIYLSVR